MFYVSNYKLVPGGKEWTDRVELLAGEVFRKSKELVELYQMHPNARNHCECLEPDEIWFLDTENIGPVTGYCLNCSGWLESR